MTTPKHPGGRPRNPAALRRTGKPLHVLLPQDEHSQAILDAEARGMALAEHVRDLLKRWRRRHPVRSPGGAGG